MPRQGRPLAKWLDTIAKSKKRKLTTKEMVEIACVDRSNVHRAMKRLEVDGEMIKDGRQYVKAYSVNAIRQAMKARSKPSG